MSESDRTGELVELLRGAVRPGDVLEGPGGIETMTALLREHADPDLVTVMVSEGGAVQRYAGTEGFREALREWITPYERYRLVMDELIADRDRVVFVVRQVAVTRHGGVEIETPSASVWSLLDGRIAEARFYLDQAAGLRAAGIDPRSR